MSVAPSCSHLDQISVTELPESIAGCEECLKIGSGWVHLRMCMSAARSAAATRRRTGTRAATHARTATRSRARQSQERTGAGATWTRSRSSSRRAVGPSGGARKETQHARIPRLPWPPQARSRARPTPARPVRDRRLPGAVGRPHPAHPARGVGDLDRRRRRNGEAGPGTSSRRCRTRPSRWTSTASPAGRSSTRAGRACRVDTLLDGVDRRAPAYVLAFCDGGYTTNLPIEDVTGGKAWIAYRLRRRAARAGARRAGPAAGAAPVLLEEREVGARARAARRGRARLLGALGYHKYGDPWREQRYAGD